MGKNKEFPNISWGKPIFDLTNFYRDTATVGFQR
jgi:hypothetical protein